MARKKIEPITGMGSDPDNKLMVQKSRPLFSLWRSGLTLAEFKILDTYLSRIDSHKPDKRTVVFEKGELEKLLGVKRIRTEELDERLKNLGTPIRVDDITAKNKKFARISLFEKSVAEQDENGLWQIELTASQSAMKYFFNIENLGYLRYKLRCVTSITSRYTYIMFVYLEANRFRKSWEIDLQELKTILNCETEETYKQFKRFNDLILKKVQKEMHEKTECRFSYEPVKKGRVVTAIRFTVDTLPRLDGVDDPNQITIFDYEEQQLQGDRIAFLQGACAPKGTSEPEFSREEMTEILEVLATVPDYKLPADPATGTNDMNFRQYHYLSMQYAAMNRRDTQKRIKNRFAYLLKMVKADAGLE